MKKSMRKGFTLIVVIGILSAMMMLSTDEAISSARAADIVNDLRNLKTAALEWYADNIPYVEGKKGAALPAGMDEGWNKTFAEAQLGGVTKSIRRYTGTDGIGGYIFTGEDCSTEAKFWYVWIKVDDSKVVDKLKTRSKTVGLCAAKNVSKNTPPSGITSGDKFSLQKGEFVGMLIRDYAN